MADHEKVYGICANKCLVEVVPKGVPVDNAINADNADNADHANSAEKSIKRVDGTYVGFTHDNDNVLKVNDEIITKKKLLWSGDVSSGSITTNENVSDGDILEICLRVSNNLSYFKFKVSNKITIFTASETSILENSIVLESVTLKLTNSNVISLSDAFRYVKHATYGDSFSTASNVHLYSIYKIIE